MEGWSYEGCLDKVEDYQDIVASIRVPTTGDLKEHIRLGKQFDVGRLTFFHAIPARDLLLAKIAQDVHDAAGQEGPQGDEPPSETQVLGWASGIYSWATWQGCWLQSPLGCPSVSSGTEKTMTISMRSCCS